MGEKTADGFPVNNCLAVIQRVQSCSKPEMMAGGKAGGAGNLIGVVTSDEKVGEKLHKVSEWP